MSRIFLLEDDPDRVIQIVRRVDHDTDHRPLHTIDSASTYWQRDRFKPPYDVILLDHDLGGRQMEAHEDDGYEFFNAIRNDIGEAAVILHSWNPEGAARQKSLYPSAIIAPFGEPRFWSLLSTLLRSK